MTRKYHNHTLQTNACHHEEESHNTNSHETTRVNNVKQLAVFPIVKIERTLSTTQQKQGPNTESPQTMASDCIIYMQQLGLITDVFSLFRRSVLKSGIFIKLPNSKFYQLSLHRKINMMLHCKPSQEMVGVM